MNRSIYITLKQIYLKINRSSYNKLYVEFLQNQHKTADELNKLNWQKRKDLLKYAFLTIPFYKTKFSNAGIALKDMESPDVWQKIPILTKKEISENFNEICSPNLVEGTYRVSTTGGSTGVPTKVLHDKRFPHTVLGDRMLSWWKLQPNDDQGRIWRLRGKSEVKAAKWKMFIKSFIPGLNQKVITLDASYMDNQSIDQFIDEWNKTGPPLLTGYVGGVNHVADYILKNNIKMHPPKAVWLTAAPVSNTQRSMIEKAFNAPVYDQYGTCEVYWLAAECPSHKGLHMFEDARHIEFVDANGEICQPGEYGRILVTDLYNKVFPLIRYEIGDKGRQLDTTCDCGVNLPLMDAVKGRITDVIRFKDGTTISGEYLTTIFDDYPDAVKAFQVWQRSDYSIAIKVLPALEEKALKSITQMVEKNLSQKIKNAEPVETIIVSEIVSDRGKTNYVISDVK